MSTEKREKLLREVVDRMSEDRSVDPNDVIKKIMEAFKEGREIPKGNSKFSDRVAYQVKKDEEIESQILKILSPLFNKALSGNNNEIKALENKISEKNDEFRELKTRYTILKEDYKKLEHQKKPYFIEVYEQLKRTRAKEVIGESGVILVERLAYEQGTEDTVIEAYNQDLQDWSGKSNYTSFMKMKAICIKEGWIRHRETEGNGPDKYKAGIPYYAKKGVRSDELDSWDS